jgi:hypothetical protein
MFVIRDDKGAILYRSGKPIADPRAVEVPADQVEAVQAEPIKAGIVWMVKDDSGSVVDLCDHYPLNADAVAVSPDHPDVIARLTMDALLNAETRKRKAAWTHVRTRLIDDALAAEMQSAE